MGFLCVRSHLQFDFAIFFMIMIFFQQVERLLLFLLDKIACSAYPKDMNLANKITFSRMLSAPLFFVLFCLPLWLKQPPGLSLFNIVIIVLLCLVFILAEISDLLDGMVARKMQLVGDVGKLLDPFADVINIMSYFLCFLFAGILPVWLFIIFMYREYSILFIRILMIKKGIVLQARKGGKIKAWFYAIASIAALLYFFIQQLALFDRTMLETGQIVLIVIFALSAAASLLSFADYLRLFLKAYKDT